MIFMIVRENYIFHVAQVDFEFTSVGKYSLRTCSGVDEYAIAVSLDDRGESSFADTTLCQHGGKNRDLERPHLTMRRSRPR